MSKKDPWADNWNRPDRDHHRTMHTPDPVPDVSPRARVIALVGSLIGDSQLSDPAYRFVEAANFGRKKRSWVCLGDVIGGLIGDVSHARDEMAELRRVVKDKDEALADEKRKRTNAANIAGNLLQSLAKDEETDLSKSARAALADAAEEVRRAIRNAQ